MFVIVSYDIADDRRRNRLAKALGVFGDRVQFSVFECNLEKGEYERMLKRLKRLIDETTDSVRVYSQCRTCKSRIEIIGQGTVTEDPDIIIV